LKVFFLLLFLTPSLWAQTFSFRGEQMETVLAKGKERTVLSGNAEVQTEDNLIRADRVELYGEDFRYVSCEGNVRIVNEQKGIEVTCQRLFYNREEKVVRVRGNVIMLDEQNEVVVKGGYLENWEDSDETVVQIGVRILKEDLVCRAEYARYQRNEDKLELSGMPVVNWKGDEYRALKIYIDLNTDTIRMEGDIRGKVRSEIDQGEGAD
jgi:lipopolysaccharide export system protein LptA